MRKILKWLKKCPLLAMLLMTWAFLTLYTLSQGKLAYALSNKPLQNPVFTALLDKNAGGGELDIPDSVLADLESETDLADGEKPYGSADTDSGADGDQASRHPDGSGTEADDSNGNGTEAEESNDSNDSNGDGTDEGGAADPDTAATDTQEPDGERLQEEKDGADGKEPDGDSSEPEVGVTKYKKYKKVKTDSPYYSDPGKYALTTTYNYQKVKKDYFDDAVFIGDSRTVGMQDYSGLDNATFFAKTGLNVYQALDDEFITDPESGKNVSVSYMLQHYRYKKIYFMIGINELGTGNTQTFQKAYGRVLRKFRAWQPDAVIYIQGIIAVSKSRSETDPIFNNININDKNVAISEFANGTDVFYLDVNPLVTDDEGNLKADYTFDEIHMYAQYYKRWTRFLMKHAVVR